MLYLVHHAEALEPAIDPRRPLSDAGREQVEQLAQAAASRGVKPSVVWHSGKLRARQTADAMWRLCNPLAELSAARGLQPGDPPGWARDLVAGDSRDILIVGHMPHLAKLLRTLLGNPPDASAEQFPLHGMVALEPLENDWREAWRLP
jgi:phosphohistidine phosphatase